MRLDLFLKGLDPTTMVKIVLVTPEPDKGTVVARGIKEEVIPTLISKDIADFDRFDIFTVALRTEYYGAKKQYDYPVIYILAKENF